MGDQSKQSDMRKWVMLGGAGLGLAMLARRRKWRRFMYAQSGGGHRFGGYGPWAPGGPQQEFRLPPFIEATLKAWHDRQHGKVPPPASTGSEESTPVQV